MTSGATSVAIAGAGIGGLAAALALARAGIASDIFERRAELGEAGAGIQLGPNATKVLERLGVLEALRDVAAEPEGLSIHDGISGRLLGRFPLGAWLSARHGAPYLTLHRQDLHRALYEAVRGAEGVALHAGVAVTGFENGGDAVDVAFSAGDARRYAALVAADGLWSKLRALVAGCDAPSPLGKCAYRAVVSPEALASGLSQNDVHIWLAENAHVVHYPVRRGKEVAIVIVIDGVAAHDAWASEADRDALLASPVGRFSDAIKALIRASDDWRMWPLQKLAPLTRWTNGAVALLGDAAHPIAPFFAQGGALAIEDAAVLASRLEAARGRDIAAALRAYETARKPRADRVVAASKRNGDIYHARGLTAVARNAVLGAVPGAAMMARYDWLYGWTAD